MKIIEEFAKKIFKTDESFVIKDDKLNKFYFFVQAKVGKAKYIYGDYDYNCECKKFCPMISSALDLKAIVTEGRAYIIDRYFFDIWEEYEKLPENCEDFKDFIQSCEKYAKEVIFPDFYKSIEIKDILDCNMELYIQKAREMLFSNKQDSDDFINEIIFSAQDIANYLCGFIDLKTEAMCRLTSKEEFWIKKKSIENKAKEIINNKLAAEEWELKIVEALRKVNAKKLTVEFSLNGKTESTKIEPWKIIYKMINKGTFDSWDFSNDKQGEIFMKALGATSYDVKNSLTCSNISKITYGKKVLYKR